jgi:hypothetical protein
MTSTVLLVLVHRFQDYTTSSNAALCALAAASTDLGSRRLPVCQFFLPKTEWMAAINMRTDDLRANRFGWLKVKHAD